MSGLDKWFLYSYLVIFGLFCLAVLFWQIQVLRGRAMRNPDGTNDDWHQQKLFFGIALADVTIAVPTALVGHRAHLPGRASGLLCDGPGLLLVSLDELYDYSHQPALRAAAPDPGLVRLLPVRGAVGPDLPRLVLVRFEAILG